MSPTDAMLMRIAERSGSGAKTGATGAAGRTTVSSTGSALGAEGLSGTGVAAHAASCSISSEENILAALVTEPDSHNVDLRSAKPASRYVELVQVVDRANVDAEVIAAIDPGALHA